MNTMRKLYALAMVAMLSVTLAFALVGCGKKAEETPAATDATDNSMTDTTMSGGMDTTMQDTTMAH